MNPQDPLAQSVSHPSPHRDRVSRWQLIVALLLAPAAFSMQVMCSYTLASRMCTDGRYPLAGLVATHALALIAAAVGLAFAWRLWRSTRHEKSGAASRAIDTGEGRSRFLALCGLYSSGIFLLAVLVDASAAALLGACPGISAFG